MTGGRSNGQGRAGARLCQPVAGSSPALPTTPPPGLCRGNPSAQGPCAGAPGRHISVTAAEVLVATLLVAGLLTAGWWWAAGVPVVYRAWPEGRCVAVEPPSWSCTEPPAIHDTVWVSPEWRPPADRGEE